MAGSRLEKFGTIYSRVRDMMRADVIKLQDKPLWFDVYEAFPPKREPRYRNTAKGVFKQKDNVPAIFYQEDVVRAKFYQMYVSNAPFDLFKPNYVSTCQSFVEKYMELQSRLNINDSEDLLEMTAKELLNVGIILRRRGPRPSVSELSKVSAESELEGKDDFAEEESDDDDDDERTAEDRTHTS